MKKRMRKNFSVKEQYKLSWDYIKESKNFIWGIVIIFFVFVLVGFFVPAPPELSEKILQFIRELLEQTEGMSYGELMGFIFLNNLQSSFFGFVFGIVLGVFPIIGAISNGYLIGFVSAVTSSENGIFVLWHLLPHGIFELPAIFISLGLGLKLGGKFLEKYFKIKNFILQLLLMFFLTFLSLIFIMLLYSLSVLLSSLIVLFLLIIFLFLFVRKVELKKILSKSLRVFLFIIIPLLIIAGIIETSLIFFLS